MKQIVAVIWHLLFLVCLWIVLLFVKAVGAMIKGLFYLMCPQMGLEEIGEY